MRQLRFMIIVTLFLIYASTASSQMLEIHCINVGQGDCTVIISPTGQILMIDTGQYFAASHIYSYLNNQGIYHIDYFIPSHYHADHIGAVTNLINLGLTFGSVYDRGWEYCTWIYDNYFAAFSSIRDTIIDGQVIDLGGGTTVTCLGLNGNGLLSPPFISDNCSGGGPNDENDFSIALRLDHNNFQFFIAGDLSGYNTLRYTNIETSIGPECGDVEVYQVNHHGSRHSSNPNFLSDINPEVSIISLGLNSYGHPHTEAMQRLLATSFVYQTEDSLGNIVYGDIEITTTGYDSFLVEDDWYPMDPVSPPEDTVLIANIQNNYPYYQGREVIVKGVVTLGAGIINPYFTNAYIEDSSGYGINLFDVAVLNDIRSGNLISVKGTVDEHAGTTRLKNIAEIAVFDSNQYIWDTPFSTGDANNITHEGMRMWVGGIADSIIDNGSSRMIYINDGSGDLSLYIDDFTGVNISGYSAGNFINAYGVCDVDINGNDTSYQLIIGYQHDISNSPVTIKMIPDNPPIVVNPSGGFFEFTGILRNNTNFSLDGDVWIMLTLPNGYQYGPLQAFNNIPMGPYQELVFHNVRQPVPPGAPAGDYSYLAFAGSYPNIKFDSTFFPFRITSTMNYTESSNSHYNVFDGSGWETTDFNNSVYSDKRYLTNENETVIISENSPNPFNPVTNINFSISNAGNVRLSIYNILGQEIETLADAYHNPGRYSVRWDGSGYSSGVYFYKIETGSANLIHKMTLIK